jgi:hypothetical protein
LSWRIAALSFWGDVRARWDEAAAAADQAISNPRVRLKPMFRFSLYRPKVPIAVTGHRGTGKTLMYDAIMGKVGTNYVPPGKSQDAEPHRVILNARSGRTRCEVIVVPGQLSHERDDALDSLTTDGAFPTGLVHVTCFGHNTVWSASDRAIVGGELALGARGLNRDVVRWRNLDQEALEFEDLCNRLRGAWHRKTGVWLILAVAKCDLYWSRIDEARDYYLPGSADSRFAAALRGLVGHVGEANFAGLAVLPLSCYPEAHEFDPTLRKSRPELDQRQATVLVDRFRTVIGDFCGRR